MKHKQICVSPLPCLMVGEAVSQGYPVHQANVTKG